MSIYLSQSTQRTQRKHIDRINKIYMILSLRERPKASGALVPLASLSLASGSNLATAPHGHTQTFKLFFNRSRLLMLRRPKPIEEKQRSLRDITLAAQLLSYGTSSLSFNKWPT